VGPRIVSSQSVQGDYFGQTLNVRHVGGFSLSEAEYGPCCRLPKHSHKSGYFVYILSGTYTEQCEQQFRDCQPSMLVYHPAGELHTQHFDDNPVRLFRIEVSRSRLGDLERGREPLSRAANFEGGLVGSLARRLYGEYRSRDSFSHLALEGLALELMAATARRAFGPRRRIQAPPQWLIMAHEMVATQFAEHLTLDSIANTVGIHPVTLSREFHRYYSCTISEAVRRQRINFAARELLRPAAKLADIAARSGFYDQSHFVKTFKRLMGITPSRYRKNSCPSHG
jgi:AraC family transcriptional regulator